MTFNLKKPEIYKAVIFYRIFPGGILKFYRILLFTLASVPVIFLAVNYAYETKIHISIGWVYVVLPFAFSVLAFELFGNHYLKYPKIKSSENIADLMEFEAARMFDRAFELSRGLGEKELSTKALLAAMIEDRVMEKLFIRIIPGFLAVRKQLKESMKSPIPYSQRFSLFTSQEILPEIMKLLEDSLVLSDKHGSSRISVLDIMASFFDHSDEFRQFILSQDLDKNDLDELAKWYEHIWSFWRDYRKFWSLDNLLRQPPIGRDWVFGYARHLTAFSENLTDKMEFARPSFRLTVRKKEIDQVEQILARSGENNVILVGDEGVGKDRIILDFAEMIARGKTLPQLNYKKV